MNKRLTTADEQGEPAVMGTDDDGFLLIDAPRARVDVLTQKCVIMCHSLMAWGFLV